ncbi:MAG TPA: M48 family metalloprotease [Syntrophales bacterium]|nr:MAG: Peptidase family M48 [Syntrophorhabdus sp. PtaU1.Bin153]HOG18179.1 M48 family metalloprotease [Syntrophales bacterium]
MNKKLVMVFLLIALAGCAPKRSAYVIPQPIKDRGLAINAEVVKCIAPTSRTALGIAPSQTPNAMYDGEGMIILTEGLFRYDDNTLKFVLAHEVAHQRLGHATGKKNVRAATTGVLLVLNAFIPGAGVLGPLVHPTTQGAYSKPKELEADLEAYRACLCMGMTKDDVLKVMDGFLRDSEGGGLWDQHPTGIDRVKQIQEARE